jgi:ligand-binding sensor domain-containing protein/signal transduction histidine kinase/CheY-like chemotaxis protein/AraC-like DNA-binding protein
MDKRFLILLLISLLACTLNPVQAQKIRFYNSERGLPSSLIHRVSQDDNGYIWIATENGACYFDGMQFTTFRHDPQKPGTLVSDLVKTVFTDSRGTTWVGGSAGLQIFDSEKNVFHSVSFGEIAIVSLPYVSSIVELHDRNQILVSLSGVGVLVFNAETQTFDLNETNRLRDLVQSNFPGNLFIDSGGFVWAYSEQGNFLKINLENKTVQNMQWANLGFLGNEKPIVAAMAEDPITGNILIGTFNHGLFIYDSRLGYIRRPKGKSAARFRIRALLAETRNGLADRMNIWVGSEDSGLRQFDRESEEITTPDFQYAPIDLDNCKVHSLMQDSQGNVWVGIYQKGIVVIPKLFNDFEYIKLAASLGSTSTNIASATSIVRDRNQFLWVGTDGGGLFRLAPDGTKTRYTQSNTALPNDAILSLTVDKRGKLWISTYMGGITTYTPSEGFKNFSTDLQFQKVNTMLYDSVHDKLYFGTLGHGTQVLSFPSMNIETFHSSNQSEWIGSLLLDNDGVLWMGRTDGLRSIDASTGKELFPDVIKKFEKIAISTAFKDMDGSLWFGGPSGLYQYVKTTGEIQHFTVDSGLPSNQICAILQDYSGILWISTMKGLSRFDKYQKTFKNYYAYDGLQDNEFSTRARFRDTNGKLYFGGINGITSFYPQKISGEEKLQSKLRFSNLSVLNQVVQYDETLKKKNILDRHISKASKITLKTRQNVFSIEFTVLEYANPQKVVYAYMLKGFDKDWRYTNSMRRMATYTNLPHGTYVFKVKAYFEGDNDEVNAVYNEIEVRILPPWYQAWWAYLFYITLFMLGVWAVLNYFIGRKLRLQEREQSEKKELKLKMFTDLTHEIRTPFTLILNPLKNMYEAETESRRKEMLSFMYRNMLRILRLLNQLMDVQKIDEHQFAMRFQKTNLIDFVQDVMKSFDQVALMRNIDFRLVSLFDSIEVWVDNVHFDKVLFNVLSNAFKYAPENGFVMISADVVSEVGSGENEKFPQGYIELCIENSGAQIPENELDQIFERFYQSTTNVAAGGSGVGLHLAQRIVSLHHGIMKANNTQSGVAFVAQIPLGTSYLSEEDLSGAEVASTLGAKNLLQAERISETDLVDLELADENSKNVQGSKWKRTVVCVDDDADFVRYLRMELSDRYEVEVCTDGREAWKVISTTLPDVVITDLRMPNMDGWALCKKIRQNPETNHLPIIVVTSMTDSESERKSIDLGADFFLTKPVGVDSLATMIARAIKSRDLILRSKFQVDGKHNYDQVRISSPDNRLIAKVIESIRQNIENPNFSVDDLSREVGVSRVQLNRKLKENLNVSPGTLIKSIRLKQAAYLLINNKLNVSDVAFKLGYSSHSYFSNNFKDHFGMSPSEFVLKYADPEGRENLNRLFED